MCARSILSRHSINWPEVWSNAEPANRPPDFIWISRIVHFETFFLVKGKCKIHSLCNQQNHSSVMMVVGGLCESVNWNYT